MMLERYRRWIPAAFAAVLLLIIVVVGSMSGDDETSESPGSATTMVPQTTTTSTTIPKVPLTRNLERGATGDDVVMVQQRLADIGFDPGPIDGVVGTLTKQAVWAYEKLVMGVPRADATGVVTPTLWDRMQEPLMVQPRRPTGGLQNHTEIYLDEQVLVVFHKDVPALITHISSGELDEFGEPALYCEVVTYDTDSDGELLEEPITKEICAYSKTPGGVFTYRRLVEGTRNGPLGDMWNPVYFNYGIAVHGALQVPAEPASHGCVRIPLHISEYFQSLVQLGDSVLVWNGVSEPEDVTYEESLPSFDGSVQNPNPTTTTSTTTTSTTTTTVVPTTTIEPVDSIESSSTSSTTTSIQSDEA